MQKVQTITIITMRMIASRTEHPQILPQALSSPPHENEAVRQQPAQQRKNGNISVARKRNSCAPPKSFLPI